MRRFLIIMLSLILLVLLQGCATEEVQPEEEVQGEVIVLTAVSSVDPNKVDSISAMFNEYIKRVNEAGEGRVKIDLLGGPEVIPIANQMTAISKGAVDIVCHWSSHSSTVPEIEMAALSEIMPWEEREVGFYDLLTREHEEKMGVRVLGRMHTKDGFYFFSKDKITTLADFVGKKSRSHAGYDPIVKALGMTPVHMAPTDAYSALETGLVDMAPYMIFAYDFGFAEVTNYCLLEPFWEAATSFAYINAEKYYSLPPDIQELLTETIIQLERDMVSLIEDLQEEEMKRLSDGGIEFTYLSPEESEQFKRIAWDESWDRILNELPTTPERVEEVRAMISNR